MRGGTIPAGSFFACALARSCARLPAPAPAPVYACKKKSHIHTIVIPFIFMSGSSRQLPLFSRPLFAYFLEDVKKYGGARMRERRCRRGRGARMRERYRRRQRGVTADAVAWWAGAMVSD